MKFSDSIYGRHEITEPVILELLESPAILRLKNISQAGVPVKYNVKGLVDVSRYEHSLGVFLLLGKLGANLDEQIAGLLHDVSHLAFSHVADWLFHDGGKAASEEDYHEKIKEKFIAKTSIPKILAKYGFDCREILDEKRHLLLERPLPDLCADRLDYAIREIHNQLEIPSTTFIDNLLVLDGRIIFADHKVALLFAEKFLFLQKSHWGSASDAIRFNHFAKALALAIGFGILKEQDFYATEMQILQKIGNSGNQEIASILRDLEDPNFEENAPRKGGKVYKKFRYVDPLVLFQGKLERISKIDEKFRADLEHEREENKRGIAI